MRHSPLEAILIGERALCGEVAVARSQTLAAGTDVAVIVMAEGEDGTFKGAFEASGLVEDRDVRLDAPVLDPARQVPGIAVSAVGSEPLLATAKALLCPLDHSSLRRHLAWRTEVVVSPSTITACSRSIDSLCCRRRRRARASRPSSTRQDRPPPVALRGTGVAPPNAASSSTARCSRTGWLVVPGCSSSWRLTVFCRLTSARTRLAPTAEPSPPL